MHRSIQSASVLTLSCLAPGLTALRPLLAVVEAPVRVDGDLISGVTDAAAGVTSFGGIPFAAPPVGDLRWREPMPVSAWTGVRKADTFSAPCAQALLTTPRPGLLTSTDGAALARKGVHRKAALDFFEAFFSSREALRRN